MGLSVMLVWALCRPMCGILGTVLSRTVARSVLAHPSSRANTPARITSGQLLDPYPFLLKMDTYPELEAGFPSPCQSRSSGDKSPLVGFSSPDAADSDCDLGPAGFEERFPVIRLLALAAAGPLDLDVLDIPHPAAQAPYVANHWTEVLPRPSTASQAVVRRALRQPAEIEGAPWTRPSFCIKVVGWGGSATPVCLNSFGPCILGISSGTVSCFARVFELRFWLAYQGSLVTCKVAC
jgi:hypothetical protein